MDGPLGATRFFGREKLLRTAEAALANGARLLTFTGPGGVGKTCLAMQLVKKLDDTGGDVVVVKLEHVRDADGEVESELARALDLVHNDSATPSLEFVVEHLRIHRVLLVLDNCEHLSGALGEPGRLQRVLWQIYKAHPTQQIVATSQAALEMVGIERVLEVPGLSCTSEDGMLPEAVQLLLDRIDPISTPTPDVAVATAMCAAVDGFPLPVEWIASMARYRTWAEVQDVVRAGSSQYGGQQETEHAAGGPLDLKGSAEKRTHRTMRTLMQASYERLEDDAKRLWLALSVFGEGFDADAARTVCAAIGIRPSVITDGLASLVHQSVLTRTEFEGRSWYRMHSLVRAFGLEVGAEQHAEFQDQAHRAHADYYWTFARTAGDEWFKQNEVVGQRRIEARWANLRAAMTYLLRNGEPVRAFQLVMNLCRSNFFIYRGRQSEALRLLDMCLAPIEGPDLLLVVGKAYRAWTTLHTGKADVAATLLEQCRAMLAELPHQEPPTILLFAELTYVWMTEPDPTRAVDSVSALYALVDREEEFSTDQILIRVFCSLAAAFLADRDTAFRITKETWDICDTRGAEMTGAWGIHAYALAKFRHRTAVGDISRALSLTQDALRSQSANGDYWGQQWSLWLTAVIVAARGDHAVAARLFGQVWAALRRSEVSIEGLKPWHREQTTAVDACVMALGRDLFDVEVAHGRSLQFFETVELALSLPAGDQPDGPPQPDKLTDQQWACVKALIAKPRSVSYAVVAAELNISVRTFEKHLARARERMGLDTDGLLAWAASWIAGTDPNIGEPQAQLLGVRTR